MPYQNDYVSIPMLTIHPSKINIYNEPLNRTYHNKEHKRFNLSGVDKSHHDKVSMHARRKISKAIEYLIFMARAKTLPNTFHGKAFTFRIAFVTLTLPSSQIHSDNVIKEKCLNQFLIECHRRWHVKNYLWRAEKQGNGNIHFHVLVDKFIPWNELRSTWNRITNKLGYVDRYRDQMRDFHNGGFKLRNDLLATWAYKNQIKAYQEGKANDWNNPNSTDIHSIKKVSNIQKYITKYATKESQTSGLVGRLWGCNFELSDIKGAQLIRDGRISDELNTFISQNNPRIYESDHFSVIEIEFSQLFQSQFQSLFEAFTRYLVQHFGFNYQLYQSEQPKKEQQK
jgi:hypothetical protein